MYNQEVVEAVVSIAEENENDCIPLTQAFLPGLDDTLCRQRGKYYDFGDYPREYNVIEQINGDIDLTPVNNLEMERSCGDLDNRLKKKCDLNAVSRGNILKGTAELREKNRFQSNVLITLRLSGVNTRRT